MTDAALEDARLDALSRNRIVSTQREPEFDDLVWLAARGTNSPLAMLSFVDRDQLWLKAELGLNRQVLPRTGSFCTAAIEHPQAFVVQDAALDPRFARYSLVREANVRSYLGVPLRQQGAALGTLALLDCRPRTWSSAHIEMLQKFAQQVLHLLELRRLRDKRLVKTEALLASATRISGTGCWQLNMHTGEVSWSNEMYRILGLPRSTAPSLDVFNGLLHPEDRDVVQARLALAVAGSMSEFPDYRVVRPDGEIRVLQACAEIEHDQQGKPSLLSGALLDVTEQRVAEEARKKLAIQVIQSQKLESLSVLSAGVAHDFNNLLVGILGNAELAAADSQLAAQTRELLERVTEAAIEAAGLTRQLLAYTGRSHLEMSQLDLTARAQETLDSLRPSLPSSVLLHAVLETQLPAIEADPDQLQQVIINLIMNAAESYDGALGEVSVRTYVTRIEDDPPRPQPEEQHDLMVPSAPPHGRYVVFEVHDHGAGMKRDTLERVFEPFFSTKFTGRGLGLAAVLGIARAHRAVLTVRSRIGHGSTFCVFFPVLERAPRVSTSRNAQAGYAQALAGRTILVVDDEARVRQLERRVLEGYQVEVLEAASGDEAVALLGREARNIDAVLLDLVMPGMDAASTLRGLRRLQPELPVVIQSGYSHEEVTKRLAEVEEQLIFLAKPFSPKALVAKLCQVLAGEEE